MRKHSAVADLNIDVSKASAIGRHNIQHHMPQPVPEPHRQYGVYMHADPNDATDEEPKRIAIAPDWNTAYDAMRAHASSEIDKNAKWGATREMVTNNVYEIIDSSHIVRLRYDIDTIFSASKDAEHAMTWKREKDWLAEYHAKAPPVRYGIYVARNCDDEFKTEHFFLGGFQSLGEANHAMKTSAHAYLQADGGANLMERSLELLSEKGEVRQRYVIENGRWENGGFVKEEDWLRKEMNVGGGRISPISPKPASDPDVQATVTTKPILRLIPPTSSSLVTQAAPQLAPPPQDLQPESPVGDVALWCTCRQPDDGSLMVLCENEDCPIQWYHGRCVNFDRELGEEEKWYCPQCAPAKEPVKKAVEKKKRKGRGKAR